MRTTTTRIGLGLLIAAGVAAGAVAMKSWGARRLPAQSATPAPVSSRIRLEDVATRAGLDFEWVPNPRRPLTILDTFGAGCAFVDFDRDGYDDIFLVGEPRCGLFRNRRDGTFEDISTAVGLPRYTGQWKGCAVGDYDGDGFPDLFLAGYRGLRLLRNAAGRTLEDRTRAAGLPPDNKVQWGSSAGFMDLDGDRDLDLVVGNYAVFNEHTPHYCELVKGVKSGCTPQSYTPEIGRLYRNDGGRFVDISGSAGMESTHGRVLAVSFCDFDHDGRVDFYLSNDGTPADLMHNLGKLKFRNVGAESGTAYGFIPGQPIAAMGVDWDDVDGDGRLDFAVSAFENEAYSLQRNEGDGLFTNEAQEFGLVEATFRPLGFGTTFFDADNDGFPELFFANGHVYDNAEQVYPGSTFRQRMMLFRNVAGRQFVDVTAEGGGSWTRPIVGRGSARGDFDRDGRMDLLVVDYEGRPLLFHNRSETDNHWLTIEARGRGGNGRGYGARVEARAASRRWCGQVLPSASYLSTSAPLIHFGLGSTSQLDELTVFWPSGRKETLKNVQADRFLSVQEPS